MAFALGFAGGFADAAVAVLEPPPPTGGGYQYLPAPPTARRRKGRAKVRLTVTILTWGAEAEHSTRHTIATAALTAGQGATRARTAATSGLRTRHAAAQNSSRADLATHIGDPKEDDDIILAALALLDEDIR